jgi:serine/threonine protein kinase/tetratricopeptide (TPR) repeat protein
MNRCPSPHELEQLLDEQLSGAEARWVAAHVAACAACQATLERLTADTQVCPAPREEGSPAPEPFLSHLKLAAPAGLADSTLRRGTPSAGAPDREAPPDVPGYEILGELGRGGVGVVYRARHRVLGRLVALKMLRADGPDAAEELARLRLEAETLAGLRHPNFVQIYEVGACAGRPFLALEYVDGGTLAQHLAGQPHPPVAAAELVETLARAVHAAHQAGVVHRDLKPANILLHNDEGRMTNDERSPNAEARTPKERDPGPSALGFRHSFIIGHSSFGIPKIADFGLAKRLDGEKSLTRTGAVLGTPGYMAPEQAQGRKNAIGPATDVYALGAILYQALTGLPPFVGAEVVDVLMQVVHQDPVSVRRLQPKVPADLETVCLKCLAKEPGRRYPTALALADDLRRFRDGKPIQARPASALERSWRWGRRNPGVAGLTLALGLVLVTGLVAVTGLWLRAERNGRRAEEQQRQAARNLQEARRAVREHFVQISEIEQTAPADPHELRRQQLAAALKYFQGFLDQDRDNPAAQADLADAWYRVGLITRATGSQAEAARAFSAARALLEGLLERQPGQPDYARTLAQVHRNLGVLQRAGGRPGEAAASFEQALAFYRGLGGEGPLRPEDRRAVAELYLEQGGLHAEARREKEARRLFEEARGLCDDLLREQPASAADRRLLARTYGFLGYLERDGGRPGKALPLFQQARDLAEQLVRAHPAHPDYQEQLGALCLSLGTLQFNQGQVAAAQETSRRARDLLEPLVRLSPGVARYREQLAQAWANLCATQNALNQPDAALDSARRACDLLDQLARDHPDVVAHQHQLADAWTRLGVLRRQAGRLEEALQALRQSHAIRERLAQPEPAAASRRADVALCLQDLGVIHHGRRQFGEALQCFQRALDLLEPICREQPAVPYQKQLANTYTNQGNAFVLTGRMADARQAFGRARRLREEVMLREPADPEARSGLGAVLMNEGILFEMVSRVPEARDAYERAVFYQREAHAKAPQVATYRHLLSGHYEALARAQRRLRQADAAVATAQARRKLWPGQPVEQYKAACELAQCLPLVGDPAAGLGPEEEAQRRAYGDLALAALREAVAAGFRSLTDLKGSPELDPVRGREDFRNLVAEVEQNTKVTPPAR